MPSLGQRCYVYRGDGKISREQQLLQRSAGFRHNLSLDTSTQVVCGVVSRKQACQKGNSLCFWTMGFHSGETCEKTFCCCCFRTNPPGEGGVGVRKGPGAWVLGHTMLTKHFPLECKHFQDQRNALFKKLADHNLNLNGLSQDGKMSILLNVEGRTYETNSTMVTYISTRYIWNETPYY